MRRRRYVSVKVDDSFYNILDKNRKLAEDEMRKKYLPNYHLSWTNYTNMLSKYNYDKITKVHKNRIKLPKFRLNIIKYEIKKGRLK